MVIGQDRAGKTSVKKSLLGLAFDPMEPSTDGVEVNPSMLKVEVKQVKNWEPVDEPESLDNQLNEEVAKLVVEELSESHTLEEKEGQVPGSLSVSHKGASTKLFFSFLSVSIKEKKNILWVFFRCFSCCFCSCSCVCYRPLRCYCFHCCLIGIIVLFLCCCFYCRCRCRCCCYCCSCYSCCC